MHPSDGRVISNFIVQALHGAEVTDYGDDGRTRSCCCPDDRLQRQSDIRRAPDCLADRTRRVQFDEGPGKPVAYFDALLSAGV
jgi:hypothetical protein